MTIHIILLLYLVSNIILAHDYELLSSSLCVNYDKISISISFQFNPSVPISPEIPGFKKNTTLNDGIHCVCIVVDGSTVGVLPEKMLEKIKAIQAKIRQRGNFAPS